MTRLPLCGQRFRSRLHDLGHDQLAAGHPPLGQGDRDAAQARRLPLFRRPASLPGTPRRGRRPCRADLQLANAVVAPARIRAEPDLYGRPARARATRSNFEWIHPLSDILMALIDHGLTIEYIAEHEGAALGDVSADAEGTGPAVPPAAGHPADAAVAVIAGAEDAPDVAEAGATIPAPGSAIRPNSCLTGSPMLTRRAFFALSPAERLASIATGSYALAIEPRFRLIVTRYALTPPHWPSGKGSVRIAALADLHACEPWMPVSRIEEIVAATNALGPDVDRPPRRLRRQHQASPADRGGVAAGLGESARRPVGAARRSRHPRQSRLVDRCPGRPRRPRRQRHRASSRTTQPC